MDKQPDPIVLQGYTEIMEDLLNKHPTPLASSIFKTAKDEVKLKNPELKGQELVYAWKIVVARLSQALREPPQE